MATALELLSNAEACDDILTVDLDKQTIIIPSNVTILGVESDDNVRYLHFQVPRYFCKTDLADFSIRINYTNAKGGGDLYEVKNPVITEDLITFDWLVGRYAVTYKGTVEFNVCMRVVDSEGVVQREFNTTPASLPVLRGLETGEAIIEQNLDILEQWRADLFGTGDTVEQEIRDTGVSVMNDIEGAVTTYVNENADALKGPKGDKGDKGDIGATGATGPKGDTGATGATGPQGEKGETGSGFKVLDYYDTESALKSAVTSPSAGDAYGVGTAEPYDIYIYSPSKGWVNNGALQGAKGDTGPQGPQGEKGEKGDKGDTGATGPQGATGAQGPKGDKGDTGATGPAGANGTDGAKGDKGDKGDTGSGLECVTTTGDGAAYVATVPNITSLFIGASFIMVPHTASTSMTATLNVNGLGAKALRRSITSNNATTVPPATANWLYANYPINVMYNGTYWVVADMVRPYATDLYGTVPVANGGVPSCTTDDNGKFLTVVSGVPTWTTISNAEGSGF